MCGSVGYNSVFHYRYRHQKLRLMHKDICNVDLRCKGRHICKKLNWRIMKDAVSPRTHLASRLCVFHRPANGELTHIFHVETQTFIYIYCPFRQKTKLINACLQIHQMSETAGWLDIVPPTSDDLGGRLVTILPQDQGQVFGNYAQLTLLSRNSSVRDPLATEKPLTFGRSVVTNIYGWDEINDIMWVSAFG
jgi:hypothetical protein